jgi:acetyltransferase-like isoleucine patch superfamily enzyme
MIGDWFRGLALLRHRELVRDLGRRRLHLLQVEHIRRQFPTARISDDVVLVNHGEGCLTLGERSKIESGSVLSFAGERDGHGHLDVGADTWIGQYNNFRCGNGTVRVGANCLISQFCSLVATSHEFSGRAPIVGQGTRRERAGVTVSDEVWLGAGVVVLPGVSVGRGCVIGAGSVLSHSTGEYEIWAGVPAVKISER